MASAFPGPLVERMNVAREVDVETWSKDGTHHRVTIWIVVAGGEPFVRSVRGKRGPWYRELTGRGEGVLHVGTRDVKVKPGRVRSVETIDAVSAAFWRKYDKNASLFSMLRLSTLDTTLRLVPA